MGSALHFASGPPTSLRVIIVEDEALLALEMEGFLLDAGHRVLGVADDYDSAMALASETKPDLALLDIQLLGGTSGLDVAAAFKQRGIPCLFITGNCPTARGRGLAMGCLHKPTDERSLLAAVEAAAEVSRGGTPGQLPRGMHLF